MALIFGFGLVFEFPLIIFILARIGVVTSTWLRKQRKYAIIVSALIAAMLTPTTDAISMMLMFVPIVIFYELGILVAWIFGKKKVDEDSEEENEEIFE